MTCPRTTTALGRTTGFDTFERTRLENPSRENRGRRRSLFGRAWIQWFSFVPRDPTDVLLIRFGLCETRRENYWKKPGRGYVSKSTAPFRGEITTGSPSGCGRKSHCFRSVFRKAIGARDVCRRSGNNGSAGFNRLQKHARHADHNEITTRRVCAVRARQGDTIILYET